MGDIELEEEFWTAGDEQPFARTDWAQHISGFYFREYVNGWVGIVHITLSGRIFASVHNYNLHPQRVGGEGQFFSTVAVAKEAVDAEIRYRLKG